MLPWPITMPTWPGLVMVPSAPTKNARSPGCGLDTCGSLAPGLAVFLAVDAPGRGARGSERGQGRRELVVQVAGGAVADRPVPLDLPLGWHPALGEVGRVELS